ncbi:MAG: AtpZ/AtpI family protein [Calditrichaeota bacterium]|nr:AtpZ/AtpI family protein [Candidatus Cloacimonadota bacterium]MCA9785761.1 AtpZ/AtpI family protein [Candidatus Cloacimonadota bacterium]MCB1046987.1 AtpZ/AtpI family protein [Calditrichota bacterium]MCB9473343.1 AtpZ/AtpI family protein [Candidatus Delongbacteria bacterium]
MSAPGSGYAKAGQLLEVGLRFGLTVALGAWGGYKLDAWLGWRPWLMILSTAIAGVAGFYWLLLTVKSVQRRDEESRDE